MSQNIDLAYHNRSRDAAKALNLELVGSCIGAGFTGKTPNTNVYWNIPHGVVEMNTELTTLRAQLAEAERQIKETEKARKLACKVIVDISAQLAEAIREAQEAVRK